MQVLTLVPRNLQRWTNILVKSVDEMKEDFILTVKKAIVDFVLRDPSFVESIVAEYDSPQRKELVQISPSWKPSIEAAKAKLQKILHITNPCLAVLLDLWYEGYR